MNPKGRLPEEKLWETKLRHNFLTNYLQDPDIHVLLFISEAETNNIIREALRDWMVKTGSKALDPEFQAKVFLTASMEVARGVRPVGSDVLAAMGEPTRAKPGQARPTKAAPRTKPARAPSPEQAKPPAMANEIQPGSGHEIGPAHDTPPPHPAEASAPAAPSLEVAQAEPHPAVQPGTPKKPPVLDFGAEPEIGDGQTDEAQSKPSQRSRWLARHQS